MRELQRQNVWCVYDGRCRQFVVPNFGLPAAAEPPAPPAPRRAPTQNPALAAQEELARTVEAAPAPTVPTGYTLAGPDNLLDGEAALRNLQLLHERALSPWPSPFAVGLSLEAAGVISVALLNCYNPDRGFVEGAAQWAGLLNSYTELCHPSPGGISVRILVRGRLPRGWRAPSLVQIQEGGFCTLTGQRVFPRPAWLADGGGVIRDATEALDELLVPLRQHYFTA